MTCVVDANAVRDVLRGVLRALYGVRCALTLVYAARHIYAARATRCVPYDIWHVVCALLRGARCAMRVVRYMARVA